MNKVKIRDVARSLFASATDDTAEKSKQMEKNRNLLAGFVAGLEELNYAAQMCKENTTNIRYYVSVNGDACQFSLPRSHRPVNTVFMDLREKGIDVSFGDYNYATTNFDIDEAAQVKEKTGLKSDRMPKTSRALNKVVASLAAYISEQNPEFNAMLKQVKQGGIPAETADVERLDI